MKDLISPLVTFLAVASISGATATESSKHDDSKLSAARDVLTELSTAIKNPTSLGVGDWKDEIPCTVNMENQQPIGEESCAAAAGTDGKALGCLWCDASQTIGQGVCVGPSFKEMSGDYWSQLCGAGGSTPTPPPVTPAVAPTPTQPPVAPVTAKPTPPPVAPDPIVDCVSIDGQTPCDAAANCAWCNLWLLGGKCLDTDAKTTLGALCKAEEKEGNLRGDGNSGWKQLDSSCLEDALGGGDSKSCGGKTDSEGNACIWCAAGGDVFGICAASSQKDYIGSYLTCADPAEYSDVAVATVE